MSTAPDAGGAGRAATGAAREAILLLGPTASGKSDLALRLAARLPLEIVSIDSAQVYRGLDIGTAKPTAAERARVAHHLIDLRDPAEPYSAADFVRDAVQAIADIRRRGRLPLVVGGTMLYAKALREGLSDLPSADPALRARLADEASRCGWPALHARLAAVDPATAARLPPLDAQRIQRALEVWELTGRPLSALQVCGSPAHADAYPVIALVPADRAALSARIERRFDAMLAAGFLDEVRALRARGDLHAELPALRAVGYRQAWQYLEDDARAAQARAGERGDDADVDAAERFQRFRAAAIAATRQLAKRQMTWLRATAAALVVDPFGADAAARVEAFLAQ
jgi:tRNA dimethylallyltransferase